MLSFFAAQLLNVCLEPGHISEPEDEETSVNFDALKALVLPFPDIPWRGVASVCGRTIGPMYKSLQNMLHEDTEHVARLFSELERLHCADEDFEPCVPPPQSARWTNLSGGHGSNNSGDQSRRRSGSLPGPSHPFIVPSTHPSTPTIIITPPCFPQPYETVCRVPFQDSSFGKRLTLPTHPAFNEVFPPLIPTPHPLVPPVVQNWIWVDGHWQAVLPTLEEQARKGMFSRALTAKRKSCRRIGSRNTP